jgi:NitT/TauT family transport system ATP-binding protein
MSQLLIEEVSRTFPGVRGGAPTVALQPVSLSVHDNDYRDLRPSGCGKSTLCALSPDHTPTTGRVVLDERRWKVRRGPRMVFRATPSLAG